MNKKELAQVVATRLQMQPQQVEDVMDAIEHEMIKTLATGERITFWNFGRFEMKQTAARVGREFQTGGTVAIPARIKVSFAPSPNLNDQVEKRFKLQGL